MESPRAGDLNVLSEDVLVGCVCAGAAAAAAKPAPPERGVAAGPDEEWLDRLLRPVSGMSLYLLAGRAELRLLRYGVASELWLLSKSLPPETARERTSS